MRDKLEKDIQKECLSYLSLRGCIPIRINSGAMSGEHNGKKWYMKFNSEEGCSDIICGVPKDGKLLFVAIEVKRPGNEPTPKQQSFLDRVASRGGIALCVHSLDELREAFEGAPERPVASNGPKR